jgi:hypothetical protein
MSNCTNEQGTRVGLWGPFYLQEKEKNYSLLVEMVDPYSSSLELKFEKLT